MSIFLFLLPFFTFPQLIRTEIDDFSPLGKNEFGVLVNDVKNHSLVDSLDIQSKLRWKYETRSGSRIEIYDDILTQDQQMLLRVLSTYRLGTWSYRIHEEHVKEGQNHVSKNDIPWHNELNCSQFFETITGKQLEKVVTNFVGGQYVPYQMVAHIMRRGDFPKVHTDASRQDNEVSMMIYLNPKWRKNDYGDLFLYDDDKEIIAGIVPRSGRIIIWQSSIPYLPKPPSVAYKPGQLFIHIGFTKNLTKAKHISTQWLENKNLLQTLYSQGIFMPAGEETTDTENEIQLENHVVSQTASKAGEKIFVFDGLFSQDLLDDLRGKILNYGVYYYDDSYDDDNDNVQWIAGFLNDHFIKSNIWKRVQEVATFVSDGHTEWFPYDVSCNLVRNADTTQIHHDCSDREDEWTFLLYLTPEWSINHYGETVFYDKNEDDTEIITEVLPKYGRVAIFQGIIAHSARPPSSNFSGARLSFAVKLSRNEWIARVKAVQEELRQVTALRSLMTSYKDKDDTNEDQQNKDFGDSDIGHIETEEILDDPIVNELETKLEILTMADNQNIEELRSLVAEVHEKHFQTFDEMEEQLQQML